MKKLLKLLLVTSIIATAKIALAGYGTNSFFVTLDPPGSSIVTQEAIENARTNIECQPAENDPAGHWGEKIIGEQLSIRFAKDIFQTNEPVIATIIFRNTRMDRDLNYGFAFGVDLDFQFVVKDENGNSLPDFFIPPERFSHINTEWLPGTQYKYQSNLTKRYGLSKPGTYSVFVRRKAFRDTNGWVYVSSETATVKIIEPPK
jgi:hypothetical protein